MSHKISLAAIYAAFIAAAALFPACGEVSQGGENENAGAGEQTLEEGALPDEVEALPDGNEDGADLYAEQSAEESEYIKVTADRVNIRSGAGTDCEVSGSAAKGDIYFVTGRSGNWYETYFCGEQAYIYGGYCSVFTMECSGVYGVEDVIEEGCRLLGTPYVYGATRYMDGEGKLISSFTEDSFDCSSLMQYIFKTGADVNLKTNTRTQIYQGERVDGDSLERGDLLFFTNSSRKYNTGIERVGHVALYLGGNYILHTSSDYAKIESVSDERWENFIEARRIL